MRKDSVKYLGVIFDQKLSWESHVQHVVAKLCIARGILSKLRSYIPVSCRVYTWRFWRPGTKPEVCENSFSSFKTQISCLLYETSFLSSSQTKYCASLTTKKYFFTSFPFGTWLSNCMCERGISKQACYIGPVRNKVTNINKMSCTCVHAN